MDFLNINETVQSAIRIAKGVAREYGNTSYAPAHLLFALMHKDVGLRGFVESMGKDAEYLREWAEVRIEEYPKTSGDGDIQPDPKIHPLFEQADNVRLKWGLLEINPLCLLAAIATPEAGFSADELRSFTIFSRVARDKPRKTETPEQPFPGMMTLSGPRLRGIWKNIAPIRRLWLLTGKYSPSCAATAKPG